MTSARSGIETDEFARLFGSSKHLYSNHAQTSDGESSPVVDDGPVTPIPIPLDLAPILKTPPSLDASRTQKDEQESRGHGNSVAHRSTATDDTDSTLIEESRPVEKQSPWMFKTMLHKLYGLEGWAKKVKDVVEKQFMPLVEQQYEDTNTGYATKEEEEGRVHHTEIEGLRSKSVTAASQRDGGVAQMAERLKRKELGVRDRNMILKRRCVGRREWTDESMVDEEGRWIYNDVPVSSVETATPAHPLPTVALVPRKPNPGSKPSTIFQTARLAAGYALEARTTRESNVQAESHDRKDARRKESSSAAMANLEVRRAMYRPLVL